MCPTAKMMGPNFQPCVQDKCGTIRRVLCQTESAAALIEQVKAEATVHCCKVPPRLHDMRTTNAAAAPWLDIIKHECSCITCKPSKSRTRCYYSKHGFFAVNWHIFIVLEFAAPSQVYAANCHRTALQHH